MILNSYHKKDLRQLSVLVTGGAGFIGSNLVAYLLKHNTKKVRVLDNLSNGHFCNIEEFINNPSFEFIKGDIRDMATCQEACKGMNLVSHQAALGSVPRSINDPILTNEVNISGFLNVLIASRDNNIKRIIYAASSSTYGDSKELPKVEDKIGNPLSPYAVTKYVNELYASVFASTYNMELIGLRYFNVFGPNQDPHGAYAAVIPLFMKAIIEGKSAVINGDGQHTRDFTFVQNAVQANVKALLTDNPDAVNQVVNIAYGERTSLNQIWDILNNIAGSSIKAVHGTNRLGDIKDSLANINKARILLDYSPEFDVNTGLKYTFEWFKNNFSNYNK
jgi:UDP-N-acetylglucosamine 4-epimerase